MTPLLEPMLPPHPGLCALQLIILCLSYTVYAQDYTIPSGWLVSLLSSLALSTLAQCGRLPLQNTVSNTSRAERLENAWAAANEVQHKIDPSTGYPEGTDI